MRLSFAPRRRSAPPSAPGRPSKALALVIVRIPGRPRPEAPSCVGKGARQRHDGGTHPECAGGRRVGGFVRKHSRALAGIWARKPAPRYKSFAGAKTQKFGRQQPPRPPKKHPHSRCIPKTRREMLVGTPLLGRGRPMAGRKRPKQMLRFLGFPGVAARYKISSGGAKKSKISERPRKPVFASGVLGNRFFGLVPAVFRHFPEKKFFGPGRPRRPRGALNKILRRGKMPFFGHLFFTSLFTRHFISSKSAKILRNFPIK